MSENKRNLLWKFILCFVPFALLVYFSTDLTDYLSSLVAEDNANFSTYFQISTMLQVLLFLIVICFYILGIHLWEKYITHKVPTSIEHIKIKNFPLMGFMGLLVFCGYSALSLVELSLVDETAGAALIGSYSSVIYIYHDEFIRKYFRIASICFYLFNVIMFILLLLLRLNEYIPFAYVMFLLFFAYLHHALYMFKKLHDLFRSHSWLLLFICITVAKIISASKLTDDSVANFIIHALYFVTFLYTIGNLIHMIFYIVQPQRAQGHHEKS